MNTKQILEADYLDLLFDGRNKNYGSYALRKQYNHHVLVGAVAAFAAFSLFFLPVMVFKHQNQNLATPVTEVITDLANIHPNVQKKAIPPAQKNVPPPVKGMAKSTEIVVKPDNEVLEKDKPHLAKPDDNKVIGPRDIAGFSDDPTTIRPGLTMTKGVPGGGQSEGQGLKSEQPYTFVDQQPVPPGGYEAFQKYLARHTIYPLAAKQAGLQGWVTFQFVVNKQGDISDVKILKDIGGGSGAEVLRVLESYRQQWAPAKNNGHPVNAYFVGRFKFTLQ